MTEERAEEIRCEHAALLFAVAVADDDPYCQLEATMRAAGDAGRVVVVYRRAVELLAEQLGGTRAEALTDLRRQLGVLVGRHGRLLDDEGLT